MKYIMFSTNDTFTLSKEDIIKLENNCRKFFTEVGFISEDIEEPELNENYDNEKKSDTLLDCHATSYNVESNKKLIKIFPSKLDSDLDDYHNKIVSIVAKNCTKVASKYFGKIVKSKYLPLTNYMYQTLYTNCTDNLSYAISFGVPSNSNNVLTCTVSITVHK